MDFLRLIDFNSGIGDACKIPAKKSQSTFSGLPRGRMLIVFIEYATLFKIFGILSVLFLLTPISY